MKITIDLTELTKISVEADKILLDNKVDKSLAKLLETRDKIEEAISNAQKLIEEKGLKLNPNFKSVEGDLVKASYRAYGQKFYLEEDKIDQVPVEFYTKEVITKFKVNTDIVEKWAEKNKGLPIGIISPVRPKSLKLTLKKNGEPTV